MLIITNGDSAAAAIRQLGLGGTLLPWRDVLHDGPVPDGLSLADLSMQRAEFVAGCGWGDLDSVRADFAHRDAVLQARSAEQDVVLWFEHDLYDQLQLLQLLAWFHDGERDPDTLSLICHELFVAEQPVEHLRRHYDGRTAVSPAQLALGSRAWRAFTAPDPTTLAELARQDHEALPFLAQALRRHCEEFPGLADGLSRSERTILQQLAGGAADPVSLFKACQDREEARYLGDASFWLILVGLSRGSSRLIAADSGAEFAPTAGDDGAALRRQKLHLTPLGESILNQKIDWARVAGIDRWRGGVHLHPGNVWRWDPANLNLIKSES